MWAIWGEIRNTSWLAAERPLAFHPEQNPLFPTPEIETKNMPGFLL